MTRRSTPIARRRMRDAVPAMAASLIVVTVSAGCGVSVDPSSIPVPGRPGSGAGYALHIEFDNVLNLPGGAKVVLNGSPAGRLDKIRLLPQKAVADVTILDGITIPRSARVSLTQDTILGDIYISIESSRAGSEDSFAPDSTVPLNQTKPSTAVEDILVDLAAFLGGGSLMDLQSTFSTIVTQLPEDPAELRRSMASVHRTVNDLAANNSSVESLINDLSATTTSALEHQSTIASLLSERDRTFLGSNLVVMAYTAKIYIELGQLLASFKNSAPALDSVSTMLTSVVGPLLDPGGPSRASNLDNLEKLLREKVLPFLRSGSRVNVVPRGELPDDSATARQVVRNLRMIGVLQ